MASKKRTKTTKARAPRKTTKAPARKPAKATKRTAKRARKAATPVAPKKPRERDPRLPAAGTTIVRPYKGKDYRATVLEQGFRWRGSEYSSLSKLASAITGQKSINGILWFRLTEPKEKPKSAPAKETAAD